MKGADLTLSARLPVPAEPDSADLAVTVVEPTRGWAPVDLGELWRYRELLYFLVWRDVKVRYKQTLLGAAWALLQPLASMVVFSIFFGRMAHMPSAGLPYPLFVFAGLLPWTFFANAISSSSDSLVGSQNLVTKVYFPRLAIPIGTIGAGLIDFGIGFGLFVTMMAFYGFHPSWPMLYVPLIALGLTVSAIGVGSLLAALSVAYRDFRYVVPFMIQLWMFATPSIYVSAVSGLDSRWRLVLPLNPIYGLISGFRAVTLGSPLDVYALVVSAAVSLVLLLCGCSYFRRVERSFADVI